MLVAANEAPVLEVVMNIGSVWVTAIVGSVQVTAGVLHVMRVVSDVKVWWVLKVLDMLVVDDKW